MKNSGVLGFVILAIICYAIMAIGVVAALVGFAIGIGFLIRWLTNTIIENKTKTKNKNSFYEFLVQKYNIPNNFAPDEKIDTKLRFAINRVLSLQSLDPILIQGFVKLKSTYKDALSASSVWCNNEILQDFSCDSSALSRANLSFMEKGFLDIVSNPEGPFLLKSKKHKFYFYPGFVLTEVNCAYDIIDYSSISIKDAKCLYVTEQGGRIIKGASPAYYNYLHQRVDGGPDRRYKNNPSTPVYCHIIFRLLIGTEHQIICASNNSEELLRRGILQYQKDITAHPIRASKHIKDIKLDSNEYASQIRVIINERGKDVLNYPVFINLIKDYQFVKEYPNIISIYESLQKHNHMDKLIVEDCEYSDLDSIKTELIQTTNHPEDEIETTLAFLGYGLQLTK